MHLGDLINPCRIRYNSLRCESSSVVELHLAKVDVAGSNPVFRLKLPHRACYFLSCSDPLLSGCVVMALEQARFLPDAAIDPCIWTKNSFSYSMGALVQLPIAFADIERQGGPLWESTI